MRRTDLISTLKNMIWNGLRVVNMMGFYTGGFIFGERIFGNAVSVSNMVGLCSGGEGGAYIRVGGGAYSRRFTVRLTRHKVV